MEYEKWRVGENIRQVRKANHMSVLDVAVEIDKSESHLGQIECGAKGFSIPLLYDIANALNSDPNTLLGWKGELDELLLEFEAVYGLLDGDDQKYLIPLFLNMMRATIDARKRMEA